MRGRCMLNHRWADRAPSALASSRSMGEAPINIQSRSQVCKIKHCIVHFISLYDGHNQIVITIWCSSSGGPPGASPQRGPPSATRSHLTSSFPARKRGTRVRATDRDVTQIPRSSNILQWNAEDAYNKNIALAERLQQKNIDVACLQESHLKGNQRFTMRGSQMFRHDGKGRAKGGIATLVKKQSQHKSLLPALTTRQKFTEVTL